MSDNVSVDWLTELRKVNATKNSYWYEDCEKAAFNVKFGQDKWQIIERYDDDDYQGETRIKIQNLNQFFECNYYWGSCSGCDTLQGDGEAAACQMIFDEIKGVKRCLTNDT